MSQLNRIEKWVVISLLPLSRLNLGRKTTVSSTVMWNWHKTLEGYPWVSQIQRIFRFFVFLIGKNAFVCGSLCFISQDSPGYVKAIWQNGWTNIVSGRMGLSRNQNCRKKSTAQVIREISSKLKQKLYDKFTAGSYPYDVCWAWLVRSIRLMSSICRHSLCSHSYI